MSATDALFRPWSGHKDKHQHGHLFRWRGPPVNNIRRGLNSEDLRSKSKGATAVGQPQRVDHTQRDNYFGAPSGGAIDHALATQNDARNTNNRQTLTTLVQPVSMNKQATGTGLVPRGTHAAGNPTIMSTKFSIMGTIRPKLLAPKACKCLDKFDYTFPTTSYILYVELPIQHN